MFKVLILSILWTVTSCNLSDSTNNAPKAIANREIQQNSESDTNCADLTRSLNPAKLTTSSQSQLDRHFLLAYDFETAGNFDKAIFHYSEASKLADCDCDRAHAEAGKTAAQEAKELLRRSGMEVKPTQFFWGRLQQLTADLPCVQLN